MAARKHLSHDQKTREKIQTSQLVNRLTDFVNSKVELSPAQVRAIEVLLKKTLPDLSAITLNGPGDDGQHLLDVRGALTWQPPT
jgi:hypothetical protein